MQSILFWGYTTQLSSLHVLLSRSVGVSGSVCGAFFIGWGFQKHLSFKTAGGRWASSQVNLLVNLFFHGPEDVPSHQNSTVYSFSSSFRCLPNFQSWMKLFLCTWWKLVKSSARCRKPNWVGNQQQVQNKIQRMVPSPITRSVKASMVLVFIGIGIWKMYQGNTQLLWPMSSLMLFLFISSRFVTSIQSCM